MKEFKDSWLDHELYFPTNIDTTKECKNCRYFSSDDYKPIGICKRYPPQHFILNDSIVKISLEVSSADYCGEWRHWDYYEVMAQFDKQQKLDN